MTDLIILDAAAFDEICKVVCRHCAAGFTPTYRDSTKEWVHNPGGPGGYLHTICWASGLRNSRFAEVKRGQ